MMEIPNYRADSRPHRHPVTFRKGATLPKVQAEANSMFYRRAFCPSVSALSL